VGRLDGKVALVTGAARGQGEAIAQRFVAEGASVVLSDILDELGEKVSADIGPSARYIRLDVREESDWAAAVSFATGEFGRLNVLINNAGIHVKKPMGQTSLDEFLDIVRTNQVGVWLGMRAAAPALEAAGGGSIVNTGSLAGLKGMATRTAYSSSKWALRGLTRSAALELGKSGIRVNAVLPGGIDTAMATPGADHSRLPVGRVGTVEEIAELMVYLASDQSGYCTGADFVIDGGGGAA